MKTIVPLPFSFFLSKCFLQSFNCGMRNVIALAAYFVNPFGRLAPQLIN